MEKEFDLEEPILFDEETIKKERIKDLKTYFKHIYICSKCKSQYGSDLKDTSNLCPLCFESQKKSRKKEVVKETISEVKV